MMFVRGRIVLHPTFLEAQVYFPAFMANLNSSVHITISCHIDIHEDSESRKSKAVSWIQSQTSPNLYSSTQSVSI